MAGHTQGPWRVDTKASSRIASGIDDTIASVGCQPELQGQWAANARLIAAAPDLLAALEEAKLQIEYLHEKLGKETGSGNAVLACARAALHLAKGAA